MQENSSTMMIVACIFGIIGSGKLLNNSKDDDEE
jgi:hypothetical protein